MIEFLAGQAFMDSEQIASCIFSLSKRNPSEVLSKEDSEYIKGVASAMYHALKFMVGSDEPGRVKETPARSRLLEIQVTLERHLAHPDDIKAPSNETIKTQLEWAQIAIIDDLSSNKFAYIPENLSFFFENRALFGDDINKAFPVAIADIQEVGNCIAAGLYTAAVFHLMRVANIGLREIARHWGVSKIGTKELEYCRDEQIISEIERLIEARLKAAATQLHDEKWEAETKLYRGLMLDCRYFKDVDRDGTMHARNSYKKPGAMDVYAHVRDFMQRASKIK